VSGGAGSRTGSVVVRDTGGTLGGSGTVVHGPHLESVGQPGEKGKGPGPGRKEDSCAQRNSVVSQLTDFQTVSNLNWFEGWLLKLENFQVK
jgi:hypothetical protein